MALQQKSQKLKLVLFVSTLLSISISGFILGEEITSLGYQILLSVI